jgi:hypothetical protein
MMIILDLIIIGLLLSCGVSFFFLNRRLKDFVHGKEELKKTLRLLQSTTQEGGKTYESLVQHIPKLLADLNLQIDKAEELLGDLSYMNERGETLANRLEASLRHVRQEVQNQGAWPGQEGAKPLSESERELIKALRIK